MATLVTTITGLSTSAIATNGFVRGGETTLYTSFYFEFFFIRLGRRVCCKIRDFINSNWLRKYLYLITDFQMSKRVQIFIINQLKLQDHSHLSSCEKQIKAPCVHNHHPS